MFYIFANWKSYKTISQAREWFTVFRENLASDAIKALNEDRVAVVIFPPAPLLYPLHTLCIGVSGVSVGIQDVSEYGEGKHTGLVNASSAEGVASYGIVGHSETRQRGDSSEIVARKLSELQTHHISPILCVSKLEEVLEGASYIAFEPLAAIGSGQNATPDEVHTFRQSLRHSKCTFMYGGSVDETNCVQYLKPKIVEGFLVGTASLDPIQFSSLINTCIPYVES